MLDSFMLLIVGLIGILTPFLILCFGLALIVGLFSMFNVAYKRTISARDRKPAPQPQKLVDEKPLMAHSRLEEASENPIPNCMLASNCIQ